MRSLKNYIKQKQKNNKETGLITINNFADENTEYLTLSTFDEWINKNKLSKKEIKLL
ncbi:MAG: hypothetical protein WCP69_09585 [Bacteroidota bacterium]